MSIEIWFAFALASVALLAIPGPTILTVVSYSIAQGRRANIPLVAAVALGDSTALLFSLLGLGAVLATSALGSSYGFLRLHSWPWQRLMPRSTPYSQRQCARCSPRVVPSVASTWLAERYSLQRVSGRCLPSGLRK